MMNTISVIAPREKTNSYNIIMPSFIKALDRVEARGKSRDYRIVHNGVYRGDLSHVLEVVNKISGLLELRDRDIKVSLVPLDLMLHGKKAEETWIKKVLDETDHFFIIDNGNFQAAKVALRLCKERDIEYTRVYVGQ